jgi:LmbE family N-acetylglucosaminyl deacetylase
LKRAIAIAAHPDDIEFLMAGTLILLRDAGYAIDYFNIANGSCGSSRWSAAHTAEVRAAEAQAAAALIGAEFHPSLVSDLEIFYDDRILRRVAAVVREVQPEIVLTHAPVDYMEDHVNAGRLAVTAAFARSMPNYQTDPPRPAADYPVTVYHAQPHGNRDPLGNVVRPQLFVDVTSVLELKNRMLACHASQGSWLGESQQMDSFVQGMEDLSREIGAMSGKFSYAEGWRKHLHLGFCPAGSDPLREALRQYSCVG